MKGKILIVVVLILSSIILAGVIESYAAEARASATILIIIPSREKEIEKKVAEKSLKEEKASWEREVISVKDNRKD